MEPSIEDCFFERRPAVYSGISSLPPTGFGPNSSVSGDLMSDNYVVGKDIRSSILFGRMFINGGAAIGGYIVLGSICVNSGIRLRGYVMRDHKAVGPGAYCYNRSKIVVMGRGGMECMVWGRAEKAGVYELRASRFME